LEEVDERRIAPGCDPSGVGILRHPTGDVAALNPRLLRYDPSGIRRRSGYDVC
jgi:hypothetical protein